MQKKAKNSPRLVAAVALALASFSLAAACGGTDVELSPVAAEGRQIANSSGCAGCHGGSGNGGVGPAWVGLVGTERALENGSTVLVDDEYLRESISDPTAKIVDGYANVLMPTNRLTEDQVDKVVAYINELKGAADE